MDLQVVSQQLGARMQQMSATLPGFISVSVISASDGTCMFGYAADGSNRYELSAAFQLEIYKQTAKSLEIIDGSRQGIDDITITSEDSLYMIVARQDSPFLVVMQLDASKANLGLAKIMIGKLTDEVTAVNRSIGVF